MKEFNKILISNEKVIWEEKPQILPFIFYEFSTFIVGLVFSIFGILMIYALLKLGIERPDYVFILALLFLVVPSLYLVFYRVYLFFARKNTWYAFTNLRVIVQKGVIGTDFETFDYDQIQELEVSVTLIDKLFGKNSGSLSIDIGKVVPGSKGSINTDYINLIGITNPYSIYELLKKHSHNLKSDTNFPNENREEKNLGYKTDIKS